MAKVVKKAQVGSLLKKVSIPSGLQKSLKKSASGPKKITQFSSEAEKIAAGKQSSLQKKPYAERNYDKPGYLEREVKSKSKTKTDKYGFDIRPDRNGGTHKKAFLGNVLGAATGLLGGGAGGGLLGGLLGGGGAKGGAGGAGGGMSKISKMFSGSMKKGGKVVAKKKARSGTSVKKAQDGETMIGNAGAMRKTKMKERSPDGNYVVKRVTRTTPDGEKTTMKVRRSVQGFLKGAPTVAKNKALKGVPNTFFSSPNESRREAKFNIPPISKKKAKSGTTVKKCRYGCK